MQLGPLLTGIVWALLGSPRVPWSQQMTWEGAQLSVRHPWLQWFLIGFGLLLVIGFPISSGITYFSNTIPSPEGTLAIFRTVIFWFLILGFIVGLQMSTLALSSESLHEDTRSHLLVQSLSRFVVIGLWVSMILWAFEVPGPGKEFNVGGVPITLSPIVIVSLILFFLAAYIGPYIAGVQRAKALHKNIHKNELGWLHRIIEVMQFPAKREDRISSLHELQEQIETALDTFIDQRPGLQLARPVEEGKVFDGDSPEEKALLNAYINSRNFDPRVDYLKANYKCQQEIQKIITNLQDAEDEDHVKELVDSYAKTFEQRYTKLESKKSNKETTKPTLLVGIGLVIGPIATPILNQIGKWAIEAITGTTTP